MMRVRGWLWFALAFSLVLFAGSVKAETIPATPGTSYTWSHNGTDFGTWTWAGQQLCGVHVDYGNGFWFTTGNISPNSPPGTNTSYQVYCEWVDNTGTSFTYSLQSARNLIRGTQEYICPENSGWTLSGTTCTRPDCVSPEVRDSYGNCASPCGNSGATVGPNGTCVCPGSFRRYDSTSQTCGCDTADTSIYKGQSVAGFGDTSPDTTCAGGCTVTLGGIGVAAGGQWSAQITSVTGATCEATPEAPEANTNTPDEDTRTPEQKCLASGGGFVTTSSGTVCTDASDSPNPVTKTTEQETVTKDSNGAVTGSETSETVCVGSECTTTITTKDANGNVTGTTVINGTGSNDGTGDDDGPSECEKFPNRIGCAEFGEPTEGDALGTKEIGLSTLTPALTSPGTCPADVNLPRGMKFTFEYVCMYANGIRPVILALAWLSAGFLLFGMRID